MSNKKDIKSKKVEKAERLMAKLEKAKRKAKQFLKHVDSSVDA